MESRKISRLKTDYCRRQDLGDLDGLAGSIERWGLMQPIGITADNFIVYGLRRFRACEKLGWERISVIVVGGSEND